MLHRNPAKAQAILEAFITSLEKSSPRRAGLVKRNRQEFLAFIKQELRSDDWEPEIPKKLGTKAPMFAADDKTYQTALIAVFTRQDGTGPVLASNVPSGDPVLPVGGSTPNYPVIFQARGLQTGSEQEKIALIAKKLNPARLLACHSDPTLGPPVVWPISNGRDWRYPVLAGNSRTVAILSAPEERYRAYEKAIRATPEGKGLKRTPKGMRLIMLRAVIAVDGKGPLTEDQAAKLAAVSQASTAGEESAIGRAISVMRGLGIRDVNSLPMLTGGWDEAIHQDNIQEFAARNSAFWMELLNRFSPIQRATYERDDAKAAEMLVNVFIGFLPQEIAQAGFGDSKTEAALVAAMPALVALHQQVEMGEVKPGWDLYARLPKIMNVYRILRRKRLSIEKAVQLAEQEAQQVKLGETKTALSEVTEDPLSFIAAVMFYKLARVLSPSETIKKWLKPYIEAAERDSAKVAGGGLLGGLGGGYDVDPAQTLAKIISVRLPRVRRNRRKHVR